MSTTPLDLRAVQVQASSDPDVVNPDKLIRYLTDTQQWEIYDGSAWTQFLWPTPQNGWRMASKTVTFAGGAGTGAVGTVDLFSVTGDVAMKEFFAKCTTNLADAGGGTATITFGNASTTGSILSNVNANAWDANEWASPGDANQIGSVFGDATPIAFSEDIIATVANENINSGVLVIYILWRPLSDDGNIVAA